VNTFILFEECRQKHADMPELRRWTARLTEELIRQLAGLCVDADVPLASNNSVTYLIILLMNKGKKKSVTKRNKKSRKYKCQMSGP